MIIKTNEKKKGVFGWNNCENYRGFFPYEPITQRKRTEGGANREFVSSILPEGRYDFSFKMIPKQMHIVIHVRISNTNTASCSISHILLIFALKCNLSFLMLAWILLIRSHIRSKSGKFTGLKRMLCSEFFQNGIQV